MNLPRCQDLARSRFRSQRIDVDPTHNLVPGTQHITLACGRDFSDVSPLRGVILGGGEHELEVRVTMLPLAEQQADIQAH